MLGFIIGTACLIGLFMVLRRGRFAYGHGCGHSAFRGPFGGFRGGPLTGFRKGRRYFLSFLFERLDTTPAQEKVIVNALDELRDIARAQWSEVRKTRTEVATAVRNPSFDETLLGDVFARHDTIIETLRKAAIGAVAKIHAVLDDRQRERMADLIETGPVAFRHGFSDHDEGDYRHRHNNVWM